LVVRPAPGGMWTMVGDAYIHGIMNGEAFDIDKCQDICIV
jgi:hypothetical protein